MKVLVVDVGGTRVKLLARGEAESRSFPSGPKLTPEAMVASVTACAKGWKYNAISMGYPGVVFRNRPVTEPHNLGRGWVGFDYAKAFGHPVKIVNDAAMQALGSYRGGTLLFLGLGTGLGTALIVDSVVEAMELAHAPYEKASFEDYVGARGLKRLGRKKWREHVASVVAILAAAFRPTDIVLGGGNVRLLKELPPGCRAGDNANAFTGGFRLWARPGRTKRRVKGQPQFLPSSGELAQRSHRSQLDTPLGGLS